LHALLATTILQAFDMANKRLSKERQALVLASLCAGTPINAICRIYRADKAAVLRIIRETGEAFADYMDKELRDLLARESRWMSSGNMSAVTLAG